MAVENTCPQCQAPLSGDMGGLCPACLLEQGLTGSSPEREKTAAARFEAPAADELNEYFPDLEVLELLEQGGMGAVYRARQKMLDREVALKILPPQVRSDPAFAERFIREARAMARLSHPHIVTVHDFGERDGQYFLLMEFVDGVSLRQAIRAGQISPAQALALVPQICDALQYAHEEGVVHRDIKPENVLLDSKGRVKITDFGLAKLLGQAVDVTLTGTHQVMGTWHYMAPEQMQNPLSVDHRADIYSLGVVFYELLTGELPLGRFKLPSECRSLDTRLDDVVLKTLEREPAARYQRASELKTDVQHISKTHPPAPAGAQAAPPGIAKPSPGPAAAGSRPATLSFFIPELYAGFAKAHGIARFDGRQLQFEFEVRDELGGFVTSGVKQETLPLESIVSASLRTGWWKHRVQIQTDLLRPLSLAPQQRGRVQLHVNREDREAAEQFVAAVDAAVAGEDWQTAIRRSQRTGESRAAEEQEQLRRDLPWAGLGMIVVGILSILPLPLFVLVLLGALIDLVRMHELDDLLPFLISVPVGVLLVLGGLAMRRHRARGLAVAAAIAALLPTGPAWCLSLPLGIWCLTLLRRPGARHVFHEQPLFAAVAGSPPPREDARNQHRLRTLGMCLLVLGIINCLGLVIIGVGAVGAVVIIANGRSTHWALEETLFPTFLALPGIVCGALMIFGATAARRQSSLLWATAGAVAAVVPYGPLWLLSLPVGVMLLVLLNRAPVIALFGEAPSPSIPGKPPQIAEHVLAATRQQLRSLAKLLTIMAALDVLALIAILVTGAIAWQDHGRTPWIWLSFFAIAITAATIPIVRLMLAGAGAMRQLERRGLCIKAAVGAMLPCHPAVVIGLPVGIWTLCVLGQRHVRQAFASNEAAVEKSS